MVLVQILLHVFIEVYKLSIDVVGIRSLFSGYMLSIIVMVLYSCNGISSNFVACVYRSVQTFY